MTTKYDYLNGNKRILTIAKNPDVLLIPGFNYPQTFIEMGDKGYLKGEALKDYIKLTL